MVTAEFTSVGKKEQNQSEKKDYHEIASFNRPTEKERELRNEEREKGKDREPNRVAQSESPWDDLERTPSGRVRRRSAQVAVFHLQEIAEDELAKDWGTKRRIKDDLVPDSKRVRKCLQKTDVSSDIGYCSLLSVDPHHLFLYTVKLHSSWSP